MHSNGWYYVTVSMVDAKNVNLWRKAEKLFRAISAVFTHTPYMLTISKAISRKGTASAGIIVLMCHRFQIFTGVF